MAVEDAAQPPARIVREDDVFAERVRLLAASIGFGAWGGLGALAIVGVALYLTDWPPSFVVLAAPITAVLAIALWARRPGRRRDHDARKLAAVLTAVSAALGVFWGVMMAALLDDDPTRMAIMFALVLALMVSVAIGGASLPASSVAFLAPMTVLFVVAAMRLDAKLAHASALGAVLMLALVLIYAREINRVIVESIRMRFENEALNEALTEQRVKERTRVLEAASRHKSEFLATMSHELRTPLNAIIGYSEMLQEDAADAGAAAMVPDLKKIQGAGRQLLEMINAVLDLSKIEAGRMELNLEDVDLAALLDEIDGLIAPLARRGDNRFEWRLAADLAHLRADRGKLRQVLLNLLGNACKFTRGGSVRLQVGRRIEHGVPRVAFEVIDTGIGITGEQLARLFQDFTQADSGTARQYGGTGLGLSLSRRLCRLMGGDIDVTSTPGQGSRFVAWLPDDRADPNAATAPTTGAAGTVLVVDDDAAVRDLLERTFAREGLRVLLAGDGEQALQMARAHLPDVITLDIMLPGRDGWSVLGELAADPALADIPVIVVSMLDDHSTGYALGASDYLTKPVDRERLLAALRRHRRDAPVLVVDDDAMMRALLRRVLEAEGCTVVEAENGRTALQAFGSRPPGLVLLDLLMPEMDGFEFLTTLRADPRWHDLPVIIITAKDMTADDRARLNGSVIKVLHKSGSGHERLFAELRGLVVASLARRSGARR